MRLVIISDDHGYHAELGIIPEGDILIHCGDMTGYGEERQLYKFIKFFHKQPHKHKICIAGNHERILERMPAAKDKLREHFHYLEDSGITIEGINFYGSPWTNPFCSWAFNLPENKLRLAWELIPRNTNVLITHGPPHLILDQDYYGEHCGSTSLAEKVHGLHHLRYHLFGHLHESYGKVVINNKTFINASNCLEVMGRGKTPIVVINYE